MRKRMAGICGALTAFALLHASADSETNQSFLAKSIKASLIFETSPKHPTHLLVYLHLVNLTEANLEWSADPSLGIMELIDPSGKPPAPPPGGWLLSAIGGPKPFTLYGGSRMELLISTDWGNDDPKGGYVLGTDGHIWFIPKDKLGFYTVRVRFPGIFPAPANALQAQHAQKPWNLFEIPPQKIVITPSPQ